MSHHGQPRIAIVGTGFSGLCLGIQLKALGIDSFTIYEKSDRLGGTWRDNTYPGAACDTPAFSYCFSFEQKTDWSRKWAPQGEILAYLEHCARRHQLAGHIRFNTEITSARFDVENGVWHLRSQAGEETPADVFVSGVGQLNRPYQPDIPGLASFQGPCFHSARWRHDCNFEHKRVAVIGNAASAIQFVPQIAAKVRKLLIFQRSANWMIAKHDRLYREGEKVRFARHPVLARLYRWWIWLRHEIRFPILLRNPIASWHATRLAKSYMRACISRPELQKNLVPDYPIGGKRVLISDDYYQTLERDNVEVVTDGVAHFTENQIVTTGGSSYPVDIVILATGFHSTEFLAPMVIEGLGGRSLSREWADGAQAYLGISVAGFPNFFLLYGPNTNLGHNSIVFMIECQTRYIIQCIQRLVSHRLKYIELQAEAMEQFNHRLQKELSRTAWAATEKSWYKTAAGRITNNWSGSSIRYWWKTRKVDFRLYDQQPARSRPLRPNPPQDPNATAQG